MLWSCVRHLETEVPTLYVNRQPLCCLSIMYNHVTSSGDNTTVRQPVPCPAFLSSSFPHSLPSFLPKNKTPRIVSHPRQTLQLRRPSRIRTRPHPLCQPHRHFVDSRARGPYTWHPAPPPFLSTTSLSSKGSVSYLYPICTCTSPLYPRIQFY